MRTIQLVSLIILLLGISCNKEKIFIPNADPEGAVSFFPEDTSSNAAYSPIIDFIKSSDPSGSLVQKLANECGKPLWDKTAFSDEIFKHIGTDQLQASSQNNGRFLVLPFVRDSLIKSVLVCEIDNNNRVLKSKLINSKDHTKWTTKKTTGRMTADELATLFIVENYRVYGFRNFKLNDNRVFSNQTNFIKTEPRTAILREIKHQPTDQLRSLSTESVWITNTFCAVIEVPCSGDLVGVAPGQQTNYMCPVLTCIQWKQLLQDEFLPDPINYNGQGTPLESDLFSSGGGGVQSPLQDFFNALSPSQTQFWINPPNFDIVTILTQKLQNESYSLQSQNFVKWAIDLLTMNPSISNSDFMNQFLTESEGGEEAFNSAFWDDPNNTFPPQSLPSWSNFETAFPKRTDPLYDTPMKMYHSIGGAVLTRVGGTGIGVNTCAVRVSKALNYSGVIIPNIANITFQGSDGKYYFLGAQNLNRWMRKTFGCANPNVAVGEYLNNNSLHFDKNEIGTYGANLTTLLSGIRGIYSMVSNNPDWATGHADLMNSATTCDGGCHFDGPIRYVDVWKLR